MALRLLINLLLGGSAPWELDLSLWGCLVAWLFLCRALGLVCHSSYLALAASSLPPAVHGGDLAGISGPGWIPLSWQQEAMADPQLAPALLTALGSAGRQADAP